jgi:hypothetical protein
VLFVVKEDESLDPFNEAFGRPQLSEACDRGLEDNIEQARRLGRDWHGRRSIHGNLSTGGSNFVAVHLWTDTASKEKMGGEGLDR